MTIPSRSRRTALLICLAASVALSCSCNKENRDLPGFDIEITFDDSLPVAKFDVAGWTDGAPAFDRARWPKEERAVSPSGENLIVLLRPAAKGDMVFVRVEGIDADGNRLGSAGASKVVGESLQTLSLYLGELLVCGDGALHAGAEQCDDGNSLPGDGCSPECVVEAGWTCDGEPSVCRTCGDGVCSIGEDNCSCSEDCLASICGDECCSADEKCNCEVDCGPPSEDGVCCDGEGGADCADCGNGVCEPNKGEDICSCDDDCLTRTDIYVPGNNYCCEAGGEPPDAADCCDKVPGDDICCASDGETAEDDPACCEDGLAQCGTGLCCDQCSDDVGCCDAANCGDGTCCPGETATMCPEDCAGSCAACPVGGTCFDACEDGSCRFECDRCSCHYDCTAADSCNVTCPGGGCRVECGPTNDCYLDCSFAANPKGDAGAQDRSALGPDTGSQQLTAGPAAAAACKLACSGREPIDCGNNRYSCSGLCPTP